MPSAPRHSPDDYGEALLALLPDGEAWPKEDGSNLQKLAYGLGEIFGEPFDRMAAEFLDRESDPRFTRALLEQWETAFGLPDRCLSEPLTIEDRITALLQRMTIIGAQDRAFFIETAAAIGYTISIFEYSPFMVGISQVGETVGEDGLRRWEIGPPEIRFYWRVLVQGARLSWFRSGSGQAGVDPHLRIGIASDLECLLRRYKPAHTEIIFDYSGLTEAGAMAGTP